MKKILSSLLTVALTCGFASAIGIDWGADELYIGTTDSYLIADSENYGTGSGQFQLLLMFIGTANAADVTLSDLSSLAPGAVPGSPGVLPGQEGLVQSTASVGESTINEVSTWTTGAKYLMVLYNTTSGNYFHLTTDTGNTTPIGALSVSGITLGTESFEYFVPVAYQGAQIVPEPSTAALAIAGLALLFRRKRA